MNMSKSEFVAKILALQALHKSIHESKTEKQRTAEQEYAGYAAERSMRWEQAKRRHRKS